MDETNEPPVIDTTKMMVQLSVAIAAVAKLQSLVVSRQNAIDHTKPQDLITQDPVLEATPAVAVPEATPTVAVPEATPAVADLVLEATPAVAVPETTPAVADLVLEATPAVADLVLEATPAVADPVPETMEIVIGASSDEDAKVAAVSVAPTFIKKPIQSFRDDLGVKKMHLRRMRNDMSGSRSFSTSDVESPTLYLLIASLKYLDLMVQMICACIPQGGITDNVYVATKTQRLLARLRILFASTECVTDDVPAQTLTNAFVSAKSTFKMQQRSLDGTRSRTRVCVAAYTKPDDIQTKDDRGETPKLKHFVALVKFTKRLTQMCRAMYCNLRRPCLKSVHHLDQETAFITSLVVSHEHLCVVIPRPKFDGRTAGLLRWEAGENICGAFEALDTVSKADQGVSIHGLKKQKSAYAVTVYRALWHVIQVMKKKDWFAPRTMTTMIHKLENMQFDKRCIKYKRRNITDLRYIRKPLEMFWDSDACSYAAVRDLLTSQTNLTNLDDMQRARDFCLALTRNAAAATPIMDKRSHELQHWMFNLMREFFPHNLVPHTVMD